MTTPPPQPQRIVPHGRRRRAAGWVCVCLLAGGLVLDPALLSIVKRRLLTVDAAICHGCWRRHWHGEARPPAPHTVSATRAAGDYAWLQADQMLTIAHGLGPKLGTGENTLATFHRGRSMGFRFFEVDLALTRDGRLVCYHGSSATELAALTDADYRLLMAQRGHPPCYFSDLVALARSDPEIRFVLDVKNRFAEAYHEIRRHLDDPALGRSFIPQVYHFDQLPLIRAEPRFAGEIFTAYQTAWPTADVLALARQYGIAAVTLPLDHVAALTEIPTDLWLFTHPVNDPFVAARLRERGIDGIYSSYLTPLTMPDVFTASAHQ